jgi:hypothetical protein
MLSSFIASFHMCKRSEEGQRAALKEDMPLPTRFVRRSSLLKQLWGSETNVANEANNYPMLDTSFPSLTYRDESLLPADGQDSIVAPRSPRGRVDEDVDHLVHNRRRRSLGEHHIEVDGAEDLLQGVESEAAQLAFDQVWAILHDGLELEVPVPALPPGDEVQHVRALSCLPVLSAGVAGQRDGEGREEREVGGLVPHSEQAREEVDLGRDGRDGQEAGGAYNEEGEHCLVGKAGVDVGGLVGTDN